MEELIAQYHELIGLTKQFIEQEYQLPVTNKKRVAASPIPPQPIPVQPAPKIPAKIESKVLSQASIPAPQPIKASTTASKSEPVKPVAKNEAQQRLSWALDPLGAADELPLKEMKRMVTQHLPNFSLLEEVPSDKEAKYIRNLWRETATIPEVVVLSFQEPSKQASLLTALAKAIAICLAPASVIYATKIEQEQNWEQLLSHSQLKLFIASDYAIYGLPHLMKHYRENPKTGEHFLGKTPLFLLADISLYLREPLLKASLWKALCKKLA